MEDIIYPYLHLCNCQMSSSFFCWRFQNIGIGEWTNWGQSYSEDLPCLEQNQCNRRGQSWKRIRSSRWHFGTLFSLGLWLKKMKTGWPWYLKLSEFIIPWHETIALQSLFYSFNGFFYLLWNYSIFCNRKQQDTAIKISYHVLFIITRVRYTQV